MLFLYTYYISERAETSSSGPVAIKPTKNLVTLCFYLVAVHLLYFRKGRDTKQWSSSNKSSEKSSKANRVVSPSLGTLFSSNILGSVSIQLYSISFFHILLCNAFKFVSVQYKVGIFRPLR
jgi:hypothetical protein